MILGYIIIGVVMIITGACAIYPLFKGGKN